MKNKAAIKANLIAALKLAVEAALQDRRRLGSEPTGDGAAEAGALTMNTTESTTMTGQSMKLEGVSKTDHPYCEMCGDPSHVVLIKRVGNAEARRPFCHIYIQEIARLTAKEVKRTTR